MINIFLIMFLHGWNCNNFLYKIYFFLIINSLKKNIYKNDKCIIKTGKFLLYINKIYNNFQGKKDDCLKMAFELAKNGFFVSIDDKFLVNTLNKKLLKLIIYYLF